MTIKAAEHPSATWYSGVRAHRPLFALAVAMAATALVAVIGMVVDDRMITGLPLWD